MPKRVSGERVQTPKPAIGGKEPVTSAVTVPLARQMTQYQYVLPELRRIGIIAGVLFLILIALTFIMG